MTRAENHFKKTVRRLFEKYTNYRLKSFPNWLQIRSSTKYSNELPITKNFSEEPKMDYITTHIKQMNRRLGAKFKLNKKSHIDQILI